MNNIIKGFVMIGFILLIVLVLVISYFVVFVIANASSTITSDEELASTKLTKIAGNYSGTITKIVDGDTLDIRIDDSIFRIRLSLVNTPERGEIGFAQATNYLRSMCDIGDKALLDLDNTQGQSYGRYVGVVYCIEDENDDDYVNVNKMLYESQYAEILKEYCPRSEFSSRQSWAIEGCNDNDNGSFPSSSFNTLIEIKETEQGTTIITNDSSGDNNNTTNNFDNELLPFDDTTNNNTIIPLDAAIMDDNITTDDNNTEIMR